MLDEILESATTVTSDSEDYRGEDGLLYCGKCHTPREAYFSKGITLLGKNRHPIECVCRRMERERQEAFFIEQKHLGLVQRLKAAGFLDLSMVVLSPSDLPHYSSTSSQGGAVFLLVPC